MLTHIRIWLAQRFLDASLRLDPPPAFDFGRVYAKIEDAIEKERAAELGDSRESAAAHLRWMAELVEQGEVSAFDVSWYPMHPVKMQVTHAPHVGRA